jgi:sterol desaturase/sphingolipid hydroxylase (fatty acid hydroxylase superfamily)
MNDSAIPTAAALAAVFVALLALERLWPLRKPSTRLRRRVPVNLAITGLAFAAGFLLVTPTTSGLIEWSAQTHFGLLHVTNLPVAAQLVVAFLLMDVTFYYWHVANHRIPVLWRFHNVHHIDPDLDVSTAFRFHFGEVAISVAFRAVQVGLIGLPLWMFLAYEVAFQSNTMFHHSNLRLPIALERVLNTVLVTPRMHGIHHSRVRRETNSNYSVVFSWWDRLHGTVNLNVAQSRIVIGIEGYSEPDDNRLWSALSMPFRRQRDYWGTARRAQPSDRAERSHSRNVLAA